MSMNWGSVIGAGVGGLLGGEGADEGPKGYTTTTSKESVPDWLRPYVEGNLKDANALWAKMRDNPSPLIPQSSNQLSATIRGDYLDPKTNPWLAEVGDIVSGKIGASVDSRFSGAGRYASGAHQDVLGDSVGDALTQLYGANYQAERQRQAQAALAAPGFVQGSAQAEFQPFLSYASLFPNLREKATTEPYFANKAAGQMGGAMAGSQLGNMFGGSGGSGGDQSGGFTDWLAGLFTSGSVGVQ